MESAVAERAAPGNFQVAKEREKDSAAENETDNLGVRRCSAESKDTPAIFERGIALGDRVPTSFPGLGRARLHALTRFWSNDSQDQSIGWRAASGRSLS